MKINTLITKLQDIRNRFGNVEVMIGNGDDKEEPPEDEDTETAE